MTILIFDANRNTSNLRWNGHKFSFLFFKTGHHFHALSSLFWFILLSNGLVSLLPTLLLAYLVHNKYLIVKFLVRIPLVTKAKFKWEIQSKKVSTNYAWSLDADFASNFFFLNSKVYIPSTLNIDLILWHTQLIVSVRC